MNILTLGNIASYSSTQATKGRPLSILPCELLVKDFPETIKMILTSVNALVCLSELNNKDLLLKIPYTFVLGHGEMKSVLNKNYTHIYLYLYIDRLL